MIDATDRSSLINKPGVKLPSSLHTVGRIAHVGSICWCQSAQRPVWQPASVSTPLWSPVLWLADGALRPQWAELVDATASSTINTTPHHQPQSKPRSVKLHYLPSRIRVKQRSVKRQDYLSTAQITTCDKVPAATAGQRLNKREPAEGKW